MFALTTSPRRRRVLCGLVLALAASATACGDDDDSDSDAAPAPAAGVVTESSVTTGPINMRNQPKTPEQLAFIAASDAICNSIHQQVGALPAATTLPQEATRTQGIVAIVETELAKLRAVVPSPGDEAVLAGMMAGFDEVLVAERARAAAAAAGDEKGKAAALTTAREAGSRAHGVAFAFGMDACTGTGAKGSGVFG